MASDAESLQVAFVVSAKVHQWDDVVYFQLALWVRFIAFVAGEIISAKDVKSSWCSAYSFVEWGFVLEWNSAVWVRNLYCWVCGGH